jgi:hypothetical protein
MNSKDLRSATGNKQALTLMALALAAIGMGGAAGTRAAPPPRLPAQLSGFLNDYTPAAPTVGGGPYEMHGKWSLRLNEERASATFSVEMTMETADFANSDPGHDPTKLNPHTHHMTVTDGVIHTDPTDPITWQTACPTFAPPVTGGFVVTGTAFVTGNGSNPPFGNPSAVTICVLGGSYNASVGGEQAVVEYSNFTLSFASGSPASAHFGTQAINGVVAKCQGKLESKDCELATVD